MAHWYWLAIGLVIWAVCGIFAYGHTLAYFQREWPSLADGYRDSDVRTAWLIAASGPIGLAITMASGHHGFMWRLPPRKAG